ncbi:hypothetical protein JCM10296v2_005852 [Rhodotorula toruloides]
MAVNAAQESSVTAGTDRAPSQALSGSTSSTGGATTDEATAQGQAQAARRPTNLLDLPDEMLEQILLWSTDFWKTHTAGGLDYLLVNKRIWQIGFAVRMSRLRVESMPDIHLLRFLAYQQQRAVVRTLDLDILAEDLHLMIAAVANLALLSDIQISPGDVEDAEQRRAAAFCLKTLAVHPSLTEIGLFGFQGLQPADCNDLPNFPPSLRLDLRFHHDLTMLILQRCTSLQALLDTIATILRAAAASPMTRLELIQQSGGSWPTIGDHVSLPNVKLLQLVVDGMGDTHEAEGWPSLARFLSHFPSIVCFVIDIRSYESAMYTTSIPRKPISAKKLAARLEPQRLAAEQPLLAQLLVFLRSTSVLQLYIRPTWLRGHELRATRAARDDDFSFERWDVTKLQM